MINFKDICCGLTFPIIIITLTFIFLYLRKNTAIFRKISLNLRNFKNDDSGVAVISRLFAIGIPLILVTAFHTANAFGMEVWSPLLSISIAMAIVITGAIILVLGLKFGFYAPIMLIIIVWILTFYVYIQFEANII
jgi:hypothetical protein